MILAGDVGGTKSNLAFFNDQLEIVAAQTWHSRQFPNLEAMVEQFVGGAKPDRAAFGVAGPVLEGVCKTTNLPWIVDSRLLAQKLGIASVALLNDLEATAYGLKALKPRDFSVINAGRPLPEGNQAVIAAGTGLGEAGIDCYGGGCRPFPCEGGHAGFSPSNDLEVELCRYILAHFGFNDCELVLSGPGLVRIVEFLRDTKRGELESWLEEEMTFTDPAACISHAGLQGTSQICVQALNMFVDIYGAESANLGLKVMATGGIYVAGGIAPKILSKMIDGRFLTAFLGKGPLRAVLENMPLKVSLNDKTALLGAAYYAAGGTPS